LIGKDVRDSAPPDIFYEDALFIFGSIARFRLESVDKLDGREVVPALLFQRIVPERVLRTDTIVIRV